MSWTLAPLPAPRRREVGQGLPRRRRGAIRAGAVAATLLALGPGWSAEPPPVGCGRPGAIGIASHASLDDAGVLRLALTLTDGPMDPLVVRPLVFVDGVLLPASGPIEMPCRGEVVWSSAATAARHAVHWTVVPWDRLPPALARMTAAEAQAHYTRGSPPGLYPWADVELLRPAGAEPGPRPAAVVGRTWNGPDLVDDRVDGIGPDGAAVATRLLPVAVGRPVAFRLRYLAGTLGAGPIAATCLLDERQIDAFAGSPLRHAVVEAGQLIEIDGTVVVPGPGWHRLHCHLLPDPPGERPITWPRPLLALYLWGEP
jgi:hypothetical protein